MSGNCPLLRLSGIPDHLPPKTTATSERELSAGVSTRLVIKRRLGCHCARWRCYVLARNPDTITRAHDVIQSTRDTGRCNNSAYT